MRQGAQCSAVQSSQAIYVPAYWNENPETIDSVLSRSAATLASAPTGEATLRTLAVKMATALRDVHFTARQRHRLENLLGSERGLAVPLFLKRFVRPRRLRPLTALASSRHMPLIIANQFESPSFQ